MKEARKLLMTILEIPSVNSKDDEGAVAEYLAEYFQRYQIPAEVQRLDTTHANVVAFIPGREEGKTVIWNGHLDTVPYGNIAEWSSMPGKVMEKDGRLYARGASDMKSGLAAMVYALTHIDGKPRCSIQFIGTCDEEKNGLGASEIIRSAKMRNSDSILIGEPTGMKLGIAQKGCLWLEMNIKGKTSHGAYPQEGISAIHQGIAIAEKVKQFVEQFSSDMLGASTAQITMIQGGVAMNMTADECVIRMDIRMVPGLTTEMVLQTAAQVLKEEQKTRDGLDGEFTVLNDRRAIEISKEHPMTAELRSLLKKHGYAGNYTGINFFTDASVLDREGEKNILLFGPGDASMAHKPNEYVELEKYYDAIQILTELIQ
ncbi:MAG: M20 family metallopeptidase [Lachnospiraceae bacterium]|nr:M20 family metallopeptidase [Lachnospiraceae bacterium]